MSFTIHVCEATGFAYLLAGLMLLPLLICVEMVGAKLPGRLVATTWGWFAAALVLAAFLTRAVA